MKSIKQLKTKVAMMSRADLELLAVNVVISLYGRHNAKGIKLDQALEWSQDTIEEMADDIYRAKLNPDQL